MTSPICSMVVFPEMIEPASISMMSGMRPARPELVEIFKTGAMGFPVGVPNPVVNNTTFAPAATCAVTHSTSFPAVHCRLRPGNDVECVTAQVAAGPNVVLRPEEHT